MNPDDSYKRSRDRLLISLLISILLHLLIVFVGYRSVDLLNHTSPLKSEETIQWIDLKKPSYQVADITPPQKEERPDEAKFLGLYDSKVEKEQVAATPASPPQSGGHGAGRHEAQKSPEKLKRVPNKKAPSDLTMQTPQRPLPRGEGDGLTDSLPDDFFPDYTVGGKTYLNVLRFPKVSYFVRLKKIFRTTFNPIPSLRSYANQISKGQIEVVLGVAVDPGGGLAELFVINSSGLQDYDQEALRTIRDSSPFAAPPQEFLDHSSKLRMVWTFTVYL